MNESTVLGINLVVTLSIYCSSTMLLEFYGNGCNWLVGHVVVVVVWIRRQYAATKDHDNYFMAYYPVITLFTNVGEVLCDLRQDDLFLLVQ